jgi:tetratricopeptide (TPR) repeat protein
MSSSVHAQDDPVRTAFSNSYVSEKKANYVEAITELKKVYDEKSYEINLRLGWLNYEAGLYTEAMSYYQKAIDLMPYAVEPRLGFVLPAAATGDMDKVTAQYNKILEIDPKNTTANYRLGLIAYGKKDYKTAQNYFELVVNLYPFDYSSLLMLAWSDFQLNDYADAKVLFNKVLWYSPTDTSALDGLSKIK